MKLKKIITLLAVFAALFVSCENEVPPEDDPNITVAPERPSVVPGNCKLNVRWTAVAGAYNYKVFVSSGSDQRENEEQTQFDWSLSHADDVLVLDGTKLIQITLTGLQNDSEYFIWTQAVYKHGLSPFSESAQGKPIPPPDTPRGLSVTPDDIMLKASWSPPYSGMGGAVGSYELAVSTVNLDADPDVQAALDIAGEDERNEQYSAVILKKAEKLVEAGAESTAALVTGLTNGTTYYVYLRAKNTAGGAFTVGAKSGTPVCGPNPAAPAAVTVTPGNKKLSLSWDAVPNASSYAVYKSASAAASTAALVREGIRAKIGRNTAVVTGLDNGTPYYVWVAARNSENLNGAASGSAKDGSGTPAPKEAPDYDDNAARLGGMTARFVNEEFGKGDRLARKQETPLGDLTADGLVWWAREHAAENGITGTVDFAFYNGGLITGGHDAGDVTVESLRRVYYGGGGDAFTYITLTGAEVTRLFDYAAAVRHDGGGGSGTGAFGQVSGEVTYTINYTFGSDPRYGVIENLKIHGQAVEPAREYRIITSSYLCDGGDGYGAYLYSNRRKDTGVLAWRMVAEYIYDQDLPLEPETDGRIALIGAVWSGAAH